MRRRELPWLHTWAERFRDPEAGRGPRLPRIEGIGWESPITRMPQASAHIVYDKKPNGCASVTVPSPASVRMSGATA